MRILAVQETDWFRRGPHQQHHILERLAERGHEIRVIHYPLLWRQQAKDEPLGEAESVEHVTKVSDGPGVTVLSPPFLPSPILALPTMAVSHMIWIRREMRRFNPDVVIGHSILNSYYALNIAKRLGIPFVYHIIDELFELIPWPLFRGLGKVFEERNLRMADIVVGINQALLDRAVQRGADPEKCRLVRAGVDLDRFQINANREEMRHKIGIRETDIVLGYMGWVYPFSGLVEMLPSMKKATDDGKRVILLVIGDGEATPRLTSAAESLNIRGNLIITGWQPFESMPAFLNLCDVCVFPALETNVVSHIVPIKLYEYLAAGKPVFATKLEGIAREFQECDAVHLVPNQGDIVPSSLELLSDPARYSEDRSSAISFVGANCDWARLTEEFETHLEYVVSS